MPSKTGWILFALFVAEMTVTFESTMIYAALPTLIRQFGDPIMAGWLVTSHLLVAAASLPVAGRLGDIYGRRKVILVLLAIATVGTLISAISTSFGGVLLGRALQGLSTAVIPLSIGVVRESVPAAKVPLGIGMLTTAQGAGAALGFVLGGFIIDRYEWHMLFWASAVLLVVSYVLVQALVPARPGIPPKEPINWIEGLFPAPGIAAILLGLSMTKAMGWLDPRVLALITGGIVILMLWARMSLRAKEPFIDLRLLRKWNFSMAILIGSIAAFGTMNIVFVFAAYLQSPKWALVGVGLSATAAGLAKMPSNFVSFFAGPLTGLVTEKKDMRLPIVLGSALALVGWLLAQSMPQTWVWAIALMMVISFGTTAIQAGIPNLVVSAVPDERTSEAMGTLSAIRGMATAVGTQVVTLFLATATIAAPGGGASFPSEQSYRLTFGWIAAMTLLTLLVALMIRIKPARE